MPKVLGKEADGTSRDTPNPLEMRDRCGITDDTKSAENAGEDGPEDWWSWI